MTIAALEIDGEPAQLRVAPGTATALAEALHAADQDGRAVAPVGGGDAARPRQCRPAGWTWCSRRRGLNRVVEYEPADLTVTVEAGMRLADLQRLLGEQGQFLALDPPAQPTRRWAA